MYITEYIYSICIINIMVCLNSDVLIKLRHLINVVWLSPIEQSYINIINFLLHNYYGDSTLFDTANIIYKYDLFNLYRTVIYSTRIRTQEMRHLYGDPEGGNRIVHKPYIVFNNELGLIC